jgi:hypothetical protein
MEEEQERDTSRRKKKITCLNTVLSSTESEIVSRQASVSKQNLNSSELFPENIIFMKQ